MKAGGRRTFGTAALCTAILLAGAADASATIRYAAPGGTAAPANCIVPDATTVSATPCSIKDAAAGTGVMAADEVVIAPGSYSDTVGDLGVDGYVTPVAQNVHGAAGQPRPVITKNTSSGFGAFYVSAGKTLTDVEIDSAVSSSAISIENGTLDRVIARTAAAGGVACNNYDGGIIRNTVCLSTGDSGVGLGAGISIFVAAHSITLRNVTARATGNTSFGLSYQVTSAGGSFTVDAKSVIADGTSSDVGASQSGGVTTAINLDYSNYATTSPMGGATITAPGTPTNQVTAPTLAADGYHQLGGSPTVDAGAVDGSSGTTDIDGQARTMGSAPDIGADEIRPTSTALSCTPASLMLGSGNSSCTATITDTAAAPTAPAGSVAFSTGGTGSFGGGGSCALAAINASQASCQVAYTPSAVGSGTHQITGSYGGNSTHAGSQGATPVSVTAPAAAAPPGVAKKKCKKGRKLVKRKGKRRCVKKKRKK